MSIELSRVPKGGALKVMGGVLEMLRVQLDLVETYSSRPKMAR